MVNFTPYLCRKCSLTVRLLAISRQIGFNVVLKVFLLGFHIATFKLVLFLLLFHFFCYYICWCGEEITCLCLRNHATTKLTFELNSCCPRYATTLTSDCLVLIDNSGSCIWSIRRLATCAIHCLKGSALGDGID